jgi:hypothetical protein
VLTSMVRGVTPVKKVRLGLVDHEIDNRLRLNYVNSNAVVQASVSYHEHTRGTFS